MSETEPASPTAPTPAPGSPPPVHLRRRRFSFVWLIPLLAAAIAIYLGYRTYLEQGPLLTLTFNSADGLSAGQTQVKYKAVALGTVQSIDLSRDNSHVIIQVRMNNVGKRFMTSNARFWVEGSHFSLSDPSSLGSFVTGAFIAVDPGQPGGKYQNQFTGLEGPPGVRSGEPGRTYVLTVNKIGSLQTGSPVLFRDAAVGEVLGYDLGNGLSPAKITIFVKAPFDDLVRPASHFWNASGVALDVLPGEFHLEFESLQAVFSGAVAFNLPRSAAGTKPSPNNASFPLYASEAAAKSAGFAQLIPAVTYFHSSASGLAPGSPVEIYGMQVGVVTSVSLLLDPKTGDEKVRVGMALQPERNAHAADFDTPQKTTALFQKIIDRGTRAEIATTSFVTGQKNISLTIVPNAPPVKLTQEGNAYVFPSVDSNLDNIMASLSDISNKLDKMPFEQIGDNLNRLLQTANGTLGSAQTKQAIAQLAVTLKTMDTTLSMLNQSFGNDSEFQNNLQQLMQESSSALNSIKQLSDYLDRHPNALLLGRGSGQ
jgi:paraquat-inducible protein B